jgi:GTPase SAR1 family protein
MIVFDVTDRDSLDAVDKWLMVVRTGLPPRTPVFLVANKIDLGNKIEVTDEEIQTVADANGLRTFRTSAITGVGIVAMFEEAAAIVADTPPPIEVKEYGQAVQVDLAGRGHCCS